MAEVFVVIYTDCDDNDTPHWALHTVDDKADELFFEALGSTGMFFRFSSGEVDMKASESEKQMVRIGRIDADVWPEIPGLLEGVPVSTQAGWNCQNWVMQAIEALKTVHYLDEDEDGIACVGEKY